MNQRQIDTLIVTEDNYTYFTGAMSLIPWRSNTRPVIAVIPGVGDPVLIVDAALEESTKETSRYTDVRLYNSNFRREARELLVQVLKEKGLETSRIGAELGCEQRVGMPHEDFAWCMRQLTGVTFVDASETLWNVRMRKSQEEVALIRRACDITGRARQVCLEEARAGMTEKQLSGIFRKAMIEFGADDVAFVMINSFLPVQSDRPLKTGELLYLDGGAKVGNYCCDYSRLATIGRSNDDQRERFRLLVEANEAMANEIGPGVKCSNLFRVYAEHLSRAGVGGLNRPVGRVGHGQGMLVTEPPSLALTDETVLDVGFVISTEPSLPSREGKFIIEDIHLVTEKGRETLTTEPMTLKECL